MLHCPGLAVLLDDPHHFPRGETKKYPNALRIWYGRYVSLIIFNFLTASCPNSGILIVSLLRKPDVKFITACKMHKIIFFLCMEVITEQQAIFLVNDIFIRFIYYIKWLEICIFQISIDCPMWDGPSPATSCLDPCSGTFDHSTFPLHGGTHANNSLFMIIECLATIINQCFVHFEVISVPNFFHKCFTSANCVGDPFPRYEIGSKIFCLFKCNALIRSTNLSSESCSFKAIFFAKTAATKP